MLLVSGACFSQTYTITGKVTDASTGEPIPYANVYFKNLRKGTNTNFEGFYKLVVTQLDDSLTAQYLGFTPRSKAVGKDSRQTINFQLDPTSVQMQEVVIKPGENPAWRILRGVWANKDKNDKAELEAYQYESYSKVELDADNIDKRFRESKAMRPFKNIFDSLKLQAGEDGKPILPFFMSESLSDNYYHKNPERKKENIKASKLTGIGLDDGSIASQLIGTSFQDYNFYQNWMTILDKNFISPIANGGLGFYKYYLVDSLVIDNKYCYKIEFKPKRDKDLAFSGTMWIHDTTFALKRIIVEVGKQANLNYVERLKIQQDLEQVSTGHWLPAKVRILVDIAEISDKSFGMLGKMYASNQNFIVNQPKPAKFFDDRFVTDEDAQQHDEAFWEENRHDSLTAEDKYVFNMIDTIRNMPRVKSYIEVADFLVNGHYKLGKIEIGPYLLFYGNNVEEGHRFRLGFRTNAKFSRNYIFQGHLAYGTRDFNRNGLKFNIQGERFLSRSHWTKIGLQYKKDIEGLGVEDEFFGNNNLLTAASQIGLLDRFNKINLARIWFETDIVRGFNVRTYFLSKSYSPRGPVYGANFRYRPDPKNPDLYTRDFQTNEFNIEARYAYKEAYIINDNRRQRIGIDKVPILNVQYTLGFRSALLGGQFNYHKAQISLEQKMKLGVLGRGFYNISGTKIFGQIPYPMLNVIQGNETVIRSERTFNMLDFFEFVTDQSATLFYTHHFDGLIFNRIPLLNRAKLREVAGVKTAYGSISQQNDLSSDLYPPVNHIQPFRKFNPNEPYVEVFYGLENIFRFIRIDVIHRLNYKDPKPINNIGVKGGLYFSF